MELNLTIEEVNLVLSSLSDRPLNQVLEVFTKIQTQAKEQLEAKE